MSISTLYPDITPSLNLDFSNSKVLDPRITFTRASTATYYNGVTTAKAEENLLLYSQEFENAVWGKTSSSTSVTANTTAAPDGTTTADTLTATAASSGHYLQAASGNLKPVVSGTTYALSIHLKQGTNQYAQLVAGNASEFGLNAFLNIDLSTGTVGTVGSAVVSYNVKTLINGWYRVELVVTAVATGVNGNFIVALVTSNTATRIESWTAAGTETIFIWGAQLEQRSSVTSYTTTTTQPITNYVPVLLTAANNAPRFDHNPTTGESLGLLIEEQRTNLLTYSEEFDNAAWTKVTSTITANAIVAPDGTLTGDKLILNNTETAGYVSSNNSYTSGTSYTFSCYAKQGEQTDFRIFTPSSAFGSSLNGIFNLSTGTVTSFTSSSASIQSVGNGWYRCSITATATSTTTGFMQLRSNFTGNGYSGIYIWGAQLEAGAFPTSYIKTVAATATRSADAASMTGTNLKSWYSQSEGTLYTELSWPIVTTTSNAAGVTISDGTVNNSIGITRSGVGATPQFIVSVSGTTQAGPYAGNVSANTFAKIIAAYKANDFSFALNGTQTANSTDTSGTIPVVDRMFFGNAIGVLGSRYMKKFVYYPVRLTNAQLQALTT